MPPSKAVPTCACNLQANETAAMPKPGACRADYPARSLADIRLCPVFLHCPNVHNCDSHKLEAMPLSASWRRTEKRREGALRCAGAVRSHTSWAAARVSAVCAR